MKIKIASLALVAGGLTLGSALAVDMTVPYGDISNLTESVTLGIVTVNGTLNLTGGMLTASELRISDGTDQKSGKVVVDGGALCVNQGDAPCAYIGYNGGTGSLEVRQLENIISDIALGHGNGTGNSLNLVGGWVQGSSVKNLGTDSVLAFSGKGGYLKLNGTCILPVSGNLTLRSDSGTAISFRPFGNGDRYFIDPNSGTGTVRTEGTGPVTFYSQKSAGCFRLTGLPDNRVNFAHTGGFQIDGARTVPPLLIYENGNFFNQGSLQTVYIVDMRVLDVNGFTVPMKSLADKWGSGGVITNTASTAGSVVLGTTDGSESSTLSGISWDQNVQLVKTGGSRLDLAVSDFAAPLEVRGGTLGVKADIAPSAIVQSGGQVEVADGCTVQLDGADWTNPNLAATSAGTVETLNDCQLEGDELVLAGKLKVASGTLSCPGESGQTWHRLFKFTMKYPTARSSNAIALSRLRLLDADGNVLSDGLAKVAAGTSPSALAAGTCCYAEDYSESSESDVAHLFDGLTTTQVCLTKCVFTGSDVSQYTWRIVYFRLPAAATAKVVKYQLTTGTDEGKVSQSRMVTNWTLESSADGTTWQEVDARSGYSWAKLPEAPGEDMPAGPYALATAAPGPISASLGTVSVVSDATLSLEGCGEVSISGLAVDIYDYPGSVGTIIGFQPASPFALTLTNATGDPPYVLPLTFSGLADAKFKNWTISVNGKIDQDWMAKSESGVISLVRRKGTSILFY